MVNASDLHIGQYSNNEAPVHYSLSGRQRRAGKIQRRPNNPDYFIAHVQILENDHERPHQIPGNFDSELRAKEAIAREFNPSVLNAPGTSG